MKSVTIHKMDDELYHLIMLSAKKNNRSIDQEIKEKLFTCYNEKPTEDDNSIFAKFSGIWSQAEYDEFNKNIEDFERIDEEDWK